MITLLMQKLNLKNNKNYVKSKNLIQIRTTNVWVTLPLMPKSWFVSWISAVVSVRMFFIGLVRYLREMFF
jgi:hypothetical protein